MDTLARLPIWLGESVVFLLEWGLAFMGLLLALRLLIKPGHRAYSYLPIPLLTLPLSYPLGWFILLYVDLHGMDADTGLLLFPWAWVLPSLFLATGIYLAAAVVLFIVLVASADRAAQPPAPSRSANKVCLFGGSFDPVHSGHLLMAAEAQRVCGLSRVVFLPAARSPFKVESTGLFADEQRLRLLHLATKELPWAEVSELDLRMPAPSWSWRVVEAWKEAHPEDELYWLMGTDQWEQLHRWARYDYLVEQLHFIVYARGEGDAALPQPREDVRASFIRGHHPASSSCIREALLRGAPLPPDWMPAAAEEEARRLLRHD